jgi:hypothetical protein
MAQKKFIIDGGFQTSDDSIIAANLEMTGHIIPTVDSDGTTGFDLGSTTKKWRDLYLSEGSLYIDGQKVIESNSGTIVVQADPNQSLTTQVSGSGVLTLTSATTIAMNGTMQMAAGKKITDVGGNAVTFGDKVDMDSNKIENVGTPTAATDGANKSYVDSTVSDLVNGAPGALDTLNELANALGDDDDFAATMTTSLATKAAITYVDGIETSTLATAAADATTKANAAQAAAESTAATSNTNLDASLKTYADQSEADAISTASADATTKADAALVDAKTYADAAEADAISTAASDATTKSTQAETNAVASAEAKDAVRATAAASDATTKANAAQSAAEATASADATTKANAAQAAAEATASADATTKANAAQAAAVAAVTNGAGAAFDTLKEIQDAMATDAELSTAITNVTSSAASTAASDATTKADQALVDAKAYADTAEADAISTASTDATTKANAALVDAKAYTDTREGLITSAYETYADAAESDAVVTAGTNADAKVLVETNARASADTTLQTNITSEATTRASADTTLQSNIDVESGRIDSILSGAGADKDTFAEIVTFINSVDTTNDSALGTEITTRAAADTALSGRLDTIEGTGAGSVYLAEADAIATAEAKDAARATAAASDATSKANAAQAAAITAAATDATTKANAAESDAISTAATDATAKANAALSSAQAYADTAEADAISTASADATSKANAAQSAAEATAASALSTAVAGIEASISTSRFHSSVTDVTSASTVAYTLSDLVGAEDYSVYVNRQLVRPTELSSVNLSTGVVTFNASIVEVGDEIEVCGWKLVS